MKKSLSIFLGAMLSVTMLAGCGNSGDNNSSSSNAATGSENTGSVASTADSGSEISGEILLNGSTSMEKLTEAVNEAFNAKYPKARATGQYTGSSAGITAVQDGTADIGNASRELKEEEKAAGINENIVAIDGIAMAVDKNNTIEDLSKDDLAKIYTGEITNWKELGGEDQPIIVIGRESGSGTRTAFEELVGVEDACKYAQQIDSTGGAKSTVATTPGAIAYISLDAVDDTIKTVKVDGVEASEATIKSGDYVLQRPFIMATKGEISAQNDTVKAYFDFLQSEEGQEIVKQVGLITVE